MSGSGGGGEESGQDKTEEATARRIEKAREEGQIVMSREVVGFVALGAALVGMMFGLPPLGYELMRGMRGVLENGHQLQVGLVATEMMRLGLLAVLPVMVMAMIGAIAGAMLQSRGLVSAKGLKPQFSRLNPASGIKRLLGPEGGIEFLRTLIKLGVVGAALWWALGDPRELRAALSLGPGDLLRMMVSASMNLFIAAMIAFAGIAVLDYLVVRFRHLHKLRMTRQELREEVKESEGDPMIKGRIRSLRMARARRRISRPSGRSSQSSTPRRPSPTSAPNTPTRRRGRASPLSSLAPASGASPSRARCGRRWKVARWATGPWRGSWCS
jgi:flagellar biosynthetic protein FlhB